MPPLPPSEELLPGTEVRARGLRWEVVLAETRGEQTLLRLRPLGKTALTGELDLLVPFETVEPVRQELRPDRPGPLNNWKLYHEAFLLEQALGTDALLAVQPGRLRIEPYQLVPVIRALRMPRPRLLLADGVGLGKTIQAGLVLVELIARRLAHRILIVSPAGPLLEQWRTEMSERFGLGLERIDRAALEEKRRSLELGANPFDHFPLAIASMEFLRQERVLEELERAAYDVVVVDEAHHVVEAGGTADREEKRLRRLAQVLARKSDALLLLTATPHDGYDRSFASLCELLDPSLVDGRGGLRGDRYQAHVVRRLKKHVRDQRTGKPLFPDRHVHPIAVIAEPDRHHAFRDLQRALLDLVAPELRRALKVRAYGEVLSWFALLKRSVSTVAACRSTLAVVAERVERELTGQEESDAVRKERLRTLRELHRRLERFGAATAEEEEERARLEAEDLANQLARVERERRTGTRQLKRQESVLGALRELVTLADAALSADPKIDRLITEIRAIRSREPGVNLLIYTEYTTSQQAALKALEPADLGEILTLSGDDPEKRRQDLTARFRNTNPLILLSTDAAAEGLNLHQRCHHLIHLELPFNPNRLEQRNGRIDRYGQTFDPQVRYLYLRGTFEERILLRLIGKYERQRARLTFVPNTLGLQTAGDPVTVRLLAGLIEEDNLLFKSPAPDLDRLGESEDPLADAATRELLEEIDRSLRSFESAARTHSWLGEDGIGAEEVALSEAQGARQRGQSAGVVDLCGFVQDAVRQDYGQVQACEDGSVIDLVLPPNWVEPVVDLPGYDPETRTLKVTTDLDCTRDAKGRPVGFLGRAHAIVRKALDRVRHAALGSDSGGQDLRVSAAHGDTAIPCLVFTFLGRLQSGRGRALEKVLWVEVPQSGDARMHEDSAGLLALAVPERAVPLRDVFHRTFAPWFDRAARTARGLAEESFGSTAAAFRVSQELRAYHERQELDAWLRQRALDLTGPARPAIRQATLFGQQPPDAPNSDTWTALSDPRERLAAFAQDRTQSAAHRSEAETVMRLDRDRSADLVARSTLEPPQVHALGLLLLTPKGA